MAARDRADALLRRAATAARPRAAAAAAEGDFDAPVAPRRAFSAFNQEDLARASVLAAELDSRAEAAAEADLDGAVNLAEEAVASGEDPALVAHALSLFAAHSPAGRQLRLGRPVETAMPALLPSAAVVVQTGGSAGGEKALDYWREDPLANEHHAHWHVVYPSIGLRRPNASPALLQKIRQRGLPSLTDAELEQVFRYQPRHGELFVYMHQQMLARYDAERLSVGLAPVEALGPTLAGAQIPEAYDPGPVLTAALFGPRPANRTMDPEGGRRLEEWRAEFDKAVDSGSFRTPGGPAPLDRDNVGVNLEAALRIFRGGVPERSYGNLHNTGHGVISNLSDQVDPQEEARGVMSSTVTAIREPAFYRWHRFIDEAAARWQDAQEKLSFDDRPPVRMRKSGDGWQSPDIILLRAAELPGGDSIDPAPIEKAFLDAWDQDFSIDPNVVADGAELRVADELTTFMRSATVPVSAGDAQNVVEVKHLSHDPFAYVFRLENTSDKPAAVTLRIFLAAEELAGSRRHWIEMDKFTARLGPKERKALLRLDNQSEVIKKPVDLGPDAYIPAVETEDTRCSCGWPYTLLLPRGTPEGMPFRLIAVATDAAIDGFVSIQACGSVSFCGARDEAYPDKREMGYPFHRAWERPIAAALPEEPQMAGRRLTIRHRGAVPPA